MEPNETLTATGPMPAISAHFKTREPSDIRVASILFAQRTDEVRAVNVAIGNVSLPMHPVLQARLRSLGEASSPFAGGVVGYTATVGTAEARNAFLRILAASNLPHEGLHVQITDGGSQAMELVILGVCGPAGSHERPLLLIDAAYTNYAAFASRLGRSTCNITRLLGDDGRFTLPSTEEIEQVIARHRPGAIVVIPYDNPTGHFYDQASLDALGHLCVKHNLWLIGDEAYRELHYVDEPTSSIWAISEQEVPGIRGRRISIETASKVWNACGLRIGALVTDNEEMHHRAVAENTASLSSSALGQYVFGALAHEPVESLNAWFGQQREYYRAMLQGFAAEMAERLPGLIIGRPEAALYTVLDVRNLVSAEFDAGEFANDCATHGSVEMEDGNWTLLTAPMKGFYAPQDGQPNPGRTQVRIAFVETPDRMAKVPFLFSSLLRSYLERTGQGSA